MAELLETPTDAEYRTTEQAIPISKVMLGLLNIDRKYQREIRPSKIKYLKDHWDWRKFHPLSVSRRVGGPRAGELFIWDGQHRYLTAGELFSEYQELPCTISDMTYQQEAEFFARQHEGSSSVGGNVRFRALVEAGDPEANDVVRVIKDAGYHVTLAGGGNINSGNTIAAVTTMLALYRRMGADGLRLVLHVASKSWPVGVPDRVAGKPLAGIAHFLHYFPQADVNHLIERLAQPDATPQRISQSASVYTVSGSASNGSTLNAPMSRAIMDRYNRSLRGSKRLEWAITDSAGRKYKK